MLDVQDMKVVRKWHHLKCPPAVGNFLRVLNGAGPKPVF
jgi:hypothetical protein